MELKIIKSEKQYQEYLTWVDELFDNSLTSFNIHESYALYKPTPNITFEYPGRVPTDNMVVTKS